MPSAVLLALQALTSFQYFKKKNGEEARHLDGTSESPKGILLSDVLHFDSPLPTEESRSETWNPELFLAVKRSMQTKTTF